MADHPDDLFFLDLFRRYIGGKRLICLWCKDKFRSRGGLVFCYDCRTPGRLFLFLWSEMHDRGLYDEYQEFLDDQGCYEYNEPSPLTTTTYLDQVD